MEVGSKLGDIDGGWLGADRGGSVGEALGIGDGRDDGFDIGTAVGQCDEGFGLGWLEGVGSGASVGPGEGSTLGKDVGETTGRLPERTTAPATGQQSAALSDPAPSGVGAAIGRQRRQTRRSLRGRQGRQHRQRRQLRGMREHAAVGHAKVIAERRFLAAEVPASLIGKLEPDILRRRARRDLQLVATVRQAQPIGARVTVRQRAGADDRAFTRVLESARVSHGILRALPAVARGVQQCQPVDRSSLRAVYRRQRRGSDDGDSVG